MYSKLKHSKLFLFIKNAGIIFILVTAITKCQDRPGKNGILDGNNSVRAKRLQMNNVWVRLGDSKGQIDKERGQACVEAAAFSPDDKYVASGSRLGYELIVWDTETGNKLFEQKFGHEVEAVCFSPDGKYLLAGVHYNGIIFLNTDDWSLHHQKDCNYLINCIRYSNNGDFFAVGDGRGIVTMYNANNFTTIDSVTHDDRILSPDDTLSDGINVISLDFLPDDKYLVSAGYDKKIKIWFLPELKLIKTITGHKSRIRSVRVNPKGHCIASSSTGHGFDGDNSIKLWDIISGDLLHEFTFPLGMESVEFTPDGEFLFGAGREGKFIREEEDPALQGQGHIYVYYIPDNFRYEPVKQVHKQPVFRTENLSINKSGSKLVSSHDDGTVRLWQVNYTK